MRNTRHISAQKPSPVKGRNVIALMGINHYLYLQPLTNAVNDVNGVQAAFQQIGFETTEVLLDTRVTGHAMRALASDGLRALRRDDNLVIYFAGHGCTRAADAGGEATVTGYLIPCDGTPEKAATWITVRDWLQDLSRLAPRHILVIIDACHSGSAVGPNRSRASDPANANSERVMPRGPLARSSAGSAERTITSEPANLGYLYRRRSRLVIMSAHDDQKAFDDGPVPDHSLFTGWLLDALLGEANAYPTAHGHFTTAMEVAAAVRRTALASGSGTQLPLFDRFGNDDHGDMLIPMPAGNSAPSIGTSPALAPKIALDAPSSRARNAFIIFFSVLVPLGILAVALWVLVLN